MSFSRVVASYYEAFGVYGALAFLCHHVVGHPREISAWPEEIKSPVHVRVGTSDAWVYRQILLRGQYALDLLDAVLLDILQTVLNEASALGPLVVRRGSGP